LEHELPVFDGFSIPEQTVRNNEQTVQEQPRTVVEQAKSAVLNSSRTTEQFSNEQPKEVVLNSSRTAEQNSSEQPRTIVEQSKEIDRTVEHKMILTVPAEDVQQWKHYVKIYYRRSIKSTSSETTRQRNNDRYMEYRGLLETAGIAVTEENGNLIIN